MRRIVCVALTWIIVSSVFATELNFSFSRYSVDDGLSQNTVHAIYQDSFGFMWFGTDNGLNKFDGYKFTIYQHSPIDSASLSANMVVEIFEDKGQNLWIGNSYHGLNLYNRKTDSFRHFLQEPNNSKTISSNNIRSIYEDSRDLLWVGTSGGGLNLLNRQDFTFKHYQTDSTKTNWISSNYISSIKEDSAGKLWLGTSEGKLISFDVEKEIFETFTIFPNYKGDKGNSCYYQILVDNDNNVWYGSENGLAMLNGKTKSVEHITSTAANNYISNNPISSILQYDSDKILIGSDHGGLNVYDKRCKQFIQHLNNPNNPKSISNNQIYTAYLDKQSNLWVGNFSGGINRSNLADLKFKTQNNTTSDVQEYKSSVLGLAEDNMGNIWIASDGEGVDVLTPTTSTIKKPNPYFQSISKVVAEIYTDSKGAIWFGTYREGLVKYTPHNKKFKLFRSDEKQQNTLSGNSVWAICEDRKHQMWFGTMGYGLNMLNEDQTSFTRYLFNGNDNNSICNNDVFKILEDIDGKLWVGTRNGLNIFDPTTKKFFRFADEPDFAHLFGTWIYEIFLDSKNNIWIGTDLALNKYDRSTREFSHYDKKDGLEGNSILCILEDKRGNLWISSNKGLTRFNPENKTFRNYDISDGLLSNEFNYTSCLKSLDGKFYFGGLKGFNSFYPDSVKENINIPPVFLTDFRIFNNSISVRDPNTILTSSVNFVDTIKLSYTQSVITFEFAALNFLNTAKNQYAYYLEGFDSGWNYTRNKREVTYTNLNPGWYNLYIKGSNNDGTWNEKGKSITIQILPPFYKEPWFYLIEFMLCVGLLYSYILFREKRLIRDKEFLQKNVDDRTLKIELQKQELEQHRFHLEGEVDKRTIELKAAKERAEESDRLKSAFLANMSHEIRTPMNAIIGFSNLLTDSEITDVERKQFVDVINVNSESLLILIEDILDLSLIEANQILIKKETFTINALAEEIRNTVMFSNKKQSVLFQLNNMMGEFDLVLNSDKNRIKQILINLINNAIKFTDIGEVKFTISLSGNMVLFSVADSGIGISHEDIGFIFDRFRKFSSDGSRVFRGTGLGLAISQSLANMLGGQINVESELGIGSTFTLSLPLNEEDKIQE